MPLSAPPSASDQARGTGLGSSVGGEGRTCWSGSCLHLLGTEGEEGIGWALTSCRELLGSPATSYQPSLTIPVDPVSHLGREAALEGLLIALDWVFLWHSTHFLTIDQRKCCLSMPWDLMSPILIALFGASLPTATVQDGCNPPETEGRLLVFRWVWWGCRMARGMSDKCPLELWVS